MSQQHEVRAGDTLSQIAQRYQVSVSEIQARNPIIQDPDLIQAGWMLDIPAIDSASEEDLPPPRSADDTSSTEASCTDCQVELVELVHITGETGSVHALTERQRNELDKAVEALQAPLHDLQQAEGGPEDRIPAAKEEAWQALKDLDALPPTSSSTTARELLEDYKARWRHAQQRLDRQQRRRERIGQELEHVQREVLRPMSRQASNNPKDLLTIRIFRTLSHELEETLRNINTVLEARRSNVNSEQKNYETLDERLQFLRAALEAEIAYRIAQASDPQDAETIAQLAHETETLKARTHWPEFIASSDMNALVQRQQRLKDIEATPDPAWWREFADYVVRSDPTPSLWSLVDTAEVERYRELQDEKENLITEQEQALSYLVETSPPSTNDIFASPNVGDTRAWNVVEIKRTSESGYRYIHREALQRFRQGWQPLTMTDVKQAMSAGRFREAGSQARDALRADRELKLKIAQWKSKEDNFFNQLNIELFKEEIATEDGRFSAGAEAQMFRFAAQAGLSGSYNPVKEEVHVGGKMESAYSLLEGKASLKAQLPNADGTPLRLEYQDQKGELVRLHCGYLRADAEYSIQGFAGACASLAANVKASTAPGNVGITGDAGGEVFAGGTLKNEAAFSVKWKAAYAEVQGEQGDGEPVSDQDQENRNEADQAFKSLLEVKPEFALSAGIGAGFDYRVTWTEGKLVLSLKGHLVLGPGAGGGVAAELNGSQIMELVQFIRWSLEQSDFRFLEWIDSEAFSLISLMLRVQAVSGDELADLVSWPLERLKDYWIAAQENYREAVNAANRVMTNEKVVNYTPEAKAKVLYLFSNNAPRAFSENDNSVEQLASATFAVLSTVKTHREFMEILRRMGREGGPKGDLTDLKQNYTRLFLKFLYRSSKAEQAEQWLTGLYS
ncbi:LysM peptidoglycan-binding domain-containing protein [Marinobacter sp. GN3S48]|uniref:LysM peptidoglycan-binding domain-containing protein n=1 Tax=Marinobacter sp. GN3S48 TaxID=3382302 RepID=UPI00387B71B9